MLLRKGDKGELVQALQEALLALGYHPGPIDGHFGGLTEEALEKFQKSAKISVDGICGRTTFGELNEALVSQGAEALDLPEENNTDPEPAGKMLSWVACGPPPWTTTMRMFVCASREISCANERKAPGFRAISPPSFTTILRRRCRRK